ncbi:segregation/condensation protein A [Candidatus Parcubacteria bacterium]|nr:segregation/condensation protein A [Candidatus Parcubacteria bacterium]
MNAFLVKQDSFEGPLEMLLDLIEKRKLHVSDVSLAQVADDYVAYVRKLEHFPIEHTAHFILTAATLLLIKSKALLPSLSLTTEEEADIKDLEDRLARYQRVRELSLHLRERFGKQFVFQASERTLAQPVFSVEPSVTKPSLLEALRRTLASIPVKEHITKTVVQKIISLEEMIEQLVGRVQKSISMSFKEFSGHGKEEKKMVIVSFLAMLELVKQGIIQAEQHNPFEDITMESRALGTPSY